MMLAIHNEIVLIIIGLALLVLLSFTMRVVAKDEVLVVCRMRKVHRTLRSGLHFLIPIVDVRVARYSLAEQLLDVPILRVETLDHEFVPFFIHITYYIDDFILFSKIDTDYEGVRTFLSQTLTNFVKEKTYHDLKSSHEELNQALYQDTTSRFSEMGLKLNQIYCYFE